MDTKNKDTVEFGLLGRATYTTSEPHADVSELINAESILSAKHVTTGAVLGTVTVFTTLTPFEVRAGATGVP